MSIPDRVVFVDTTLREGEQAPGVSFTPAQKEELAEQLASVGIAEIEAGFPALGWREKQVFRRISELIPDRPIIAWNRMRRGDMLESFSCGAKHLYLSLPASDTMLDSCMRKSRDWAVAIVRDLLAFARDRGSEVILGLEDASRADPSFLVDLVGLAKEQGARRVRYVDTLGCLLPSHVGQAISPLVALGLPIEFHAHNDYGCATANALAAVEAGAQGLTLTITGIGERAGNAALEEVAVAIRQQYSLDLDLNLMLLPELCSALAEYSGRPLARNKPIVGALAFTHESLAYHDIRVEHQPVLDPSILGRRLHIIPGKHSGRRALAYCAELLGYSLETADLDTLHEAVQASWESGSPSDPWKAFLDLLQQGAYRHVS